MILLLGYVLHPVTPGNRAGRPDKASKEQCRILEKQSPPVPDGWGLRSLYQTGSTVESLKCPPWCYSHRIFHPKRVIAVGKCPLSFLRLKLARAQDLRSRQFEFEEFDVCGNIDAGGSRDRVGEEIKGVGWGDKNAVGVADCDGGIDRAEDQRPRR